MNLLAQALGPRPDFGLLLVVSVALLLTVGVAVSWVLAGRRSLLRRFEQLERRVADLEDKRSDTEDFDKHIRKM